MDKDSLIEALTEENNQLRKRLALHFMDATEEDKRYAEQLFNEQRDVIAVLEVEVSALTKSRDAFQADNRRLKRRIAALEGRK
ncbi:MAG: hypothetical protein RL156_1737 [Bacteroidota bacterium]|jgi:hypothetical protein